MHKDSNVFENKKFSSVKRSRVKSPAEDKVIRESYGSKRSRGGTADRQSRHSSKASLNVLMQERPDIGLFGQSQSNLR